MHHEFFFLYLNHHHTKIIQPTYTAFKWIELDLDQHRKKLWTAENNDKK